MPSHKDYNPQPGYPNARRVSLLLWEYQGCGAHKLDIDLYKETGLCGSCQFKEWNKNYK